MSPPRREATLREIRSFGIVLTVAGAILAYVAWRRGFPITRTSIAGTFAAVGLFAIALPAFARPLHRAWMALGHALGRITTPIVLTLVFVLVLVPARLFLLLIGRDPLQRRRLASAPSYWHERERRAFGRDDFERLS
jgi:hypothetical protein